MSRSGAAPTGPLFSHDNNSARARGPPQPATTTPRQDLLVDIRNHPIGTSPAPLLRRMEDIDRAERRKEIALAGPVSSPDLYMEGGIWEMNSPPVSPPHLWETARHHLQHHLHLVFEAAEAAKGKGRRTRMVSAGTQTPRSEVAFRVPAPVRRRPPAPNPTSPQ